MNSELKFFQDNRLNNNKLIKKSNIINKKEKLSQKEKLYD